MNEPPRLAVAMVWYSQASYDAARAIMEDRDALPARYEDWLRQAEQSEDIVRSAGKVPWRAVLEPVAFGDWCVRHGRDINAKARNDWAGWAFGEAHRPG